MWDKFLGNPIESTPVPRVVKVYLRRESEPYSSTGVAYRAYRASDDFALRIGAETLAEAKEKVRYAMLPSKVVFVRAPSRHQKNPGNQRGDGT